MKAAIKKTPATTESTPAKSNLKAVSSKSTEKSEEASKITAHPALVEALRGLNDSKKAASSYLVEVATIVQEEQLSKEEVIASIMEAQEVDRKYAGEQYSRMKKLLNDPETLEELKSGAITLKEARAKTVKKQEAPSTEKVQANAEKVITRSITQIVNKMKEIGLDVASFVTTFKLAAKKAGLK